MNPRFIGWVYWPTTCFCALLLLFSNSIYSSNVIGLADPSLATSIMFLIAIATPWFFLTVLYAKKSGFKYSHKTAFLVALAWFFMFFGFMTPVVIYQTELTENQGYQTLNVGTMILYFLRFGGIYFAFGRKILESKLDVGRAMSYTFMAMGPLWILCLQYHGMNLEFSSIVKNYCANDLSCKSAILDGDASTFEAEGSFTASYDFVEAQSLIEDAAAQVGIEIWAYINLVFLLSWWFKLEHISLNRIENLDITVGEVVGFFAAVIYAASLVLWFGLNAIDFRANTLISLAAGCILHVAMMAHSLLTFQSVSKEYIEKNSFARQNTFHPEEIENGSEDEDILVIV